MENNNSNNNNKGLMGAIGRQLNNNKCLACRGLPPGISGDPSWSKLTRFPGHSSQNPSSSWLGTGSTPELTTFLSAVVNSGITSSTTTQFSWSLRCHFGSLATNLLNSSQGVSAASFLGIAAFLGRKRIVELLLTNTSRNMNLPTRENEYSPLCCACMAA